MNIKQTIILGAGILAVILIIIFTPRYKINRIDANNFIRTEQTSSLYKRSQGAVRLHWDKIGVYAGVTIFICAGLICLLREKAK